MKETTTLEQKIIIPKVTPKQLYDSYVNPKEQGEVTGSKATGKPVVDGEFTAWDGYIFGRFLELEDGKRVVQEWMTTDWAEGYGPSKLELTFIAVVGGTEICMVHKNVPKVQAAEFAEGWEEFYWKPFKEYFKK